MKETIEQDFLVCPICDKQVKNLISHIRRTHDNNIRNRKSFYEHFPELRGTKVQISKFKTDKEVICPHCGKVYHRLNDVQNHIKHHHPELFKKQEHQRKVPTQTCPICGIETGNLRQHVRETHEIKWEDFCNQYNWDIKKSKIITDEYRKNLSDNKKKYYQSEEGQKRKEKQSKVWKENNPVYDPEKLSKSLYNRSRNGHLRVRLQDMRGIKVHYGGRTFRSFVEFKFYLLCERYNLNVEYEPSRFCVKWLNDEKNLFTTYLPDFYIDDIGIIELKQDKRTVEKSKEQQKYIKVTKVYKQLHLNYKITDYISFFKELGIELDFKDTQYIKQQIRQLADNNEIQMISPYRHSRELMNIFDTDDLSTVDCLSFTKRKGNNLYGEL